MRPQRQYLIAAPRSTHWRPATCAEVDCPQHVHGWRTVVDVSTELGQRQAHYIRRESGRRFTETQTGPTFWQFDFEPGQSCFGQHSARTEMPHIFAMRPNTLERSTPRIHSGSDAWLDDFATHQESLRRAQEG